jgi:hypothetical protein
MAGELLARYFGNDLDKIAEQSVSHNSSLPIGELALIFIPMILTALFMKGTIPKNKVLLHSIPLAITGIILAAFVLPILPPDIQVEIGTSQVGSHLLELNRAIIGGMVVLQLISLWLFSRLGKKHGKHGE